MMCQILRDVRIGFVKAEIFFSYRVAFHAAGDTIGADDLKFDSAIPSTAEDLAHRNPQAEKERILKAYNRAGT